MPTLIPALNTIAQYKTVHLISTQFHGHGWMDYLTTKHSFDSQATWVIDMFGLLFCHLMFGCVYNQALADVRSTGAGIEFCTACSVVGLSWVLRLHRKCLTLTIQAPMSMSAMTCLKPINSLIIDPLLRVDDMTLVFVVGMNIFQL